MGTSGAIATHELAPPLTSPCSSPNTHTTPPLQVEAPGTATSTVLRPLSSLTQYFISVRSTYDEGDSFPITGNVTTCKQGVEMLLFPVTSEKTGLYVSQLGYFEGGSQKLMAKTLVQNPDGCCSLDVEYVQMCYV